MNNKISIYIFVLIFILTSCGGGDSAPTTISNRNSTLIVNAGNDQTVLTGATVIISGTANDSDGDGQIVNIGWEQTSGTPVTLSSPHTEYSPYSYTTTFTAPTSSNEQNLVFKLTVTDNYGQVESDEVNITVIPGVSDVTIESSKKNVAYGDVYTLSWSIIGVGSCNITGEIDTTVTESGSMEITALMVGKTETSISCDGVSDSIIIKTIPDTITISDAAFAEVLNRMGFEVNNQIMSGETALSIERIIITSNSTYSRYTNDNGTGIYDRIIIDSGAIIGVTSNKISNLSGLEYFVNLETLRLEWQEITSFTFTELDELIFLSLWGNPLDEVIFNSESLISLGLSGTPLKTVDTSNLPNLVEAAFQAGEFESLDFSENKKLEDLFIMRNPFLTELNIKNTANTLNQLNATETPLASLDLSEFNKLSTILLSDNNNLNYLNIFNVSEGFPPGVLHCERCPNLFEIIVKDKEAHDQALSESGYGGRNWYLDDHIVFVEGP